MKIISTLVTVLFFIGTIANAQEVEVGIEPFPPLINEDGSGYIINLLNGLTKNTALTFNFHIMTYARAKNELKHKRLNLIGLTPKNSETKEFYQYANELSWDFDTTVDIFSTSKNKVNLNELPDLGIGTLIGNADYFAEMIDVPLNKFIEVRSLEQLVQMMALGRLNVVIFERVAMMSTIKRLKVESIYYQHFITLPASFAVTKDKQGTELKAKLDLLLNQTSNEQYLTDFSQYTNMDKSGVVQLK